MKKSIVFSSLTGNTELLAKTILNELNEDIYIGKPCDEALNSDIIFVGSWTKAFSCSDDIKIFLEKLNNKKIFLFMTAGYDNTDEFFEQILNNAKKSINDSNDIIGEFICQAKVSDAKQEALKKMDINKFNSMKPLLDVSQSHPNENDLNNLKNILKKLNG